MTIDAVEGGSVMTTVIDHDVVVILGECGGGMSCSTCHVFVEPTWRAVMGERGFIDDSTDGLIVTVAEHQK